MLPAGQMMVQYVGSITNEKDPEKRAANLKRYAEEAVNDFQGKDIKAKQA